jgi:hypothetical protein
MPTIGAHARALRSARPSRFLGECRRFPVRPWPAVCCSGADDASARRPPRWWTRACGHASSASCPHPATSGHGSSSRKCPAAGWSRPGDGSTADTPDPPGSGTGRGLMQTRNCSQSRRTAGGQLRISARTQQRRRQEQLTSSILRVHEYLVVYEQGCSQHEWQETLASSLE